MTTTTPNIGLILPDVSLTVGPTWASLLNAALSALDSHSHASGSGVRITPSAINISSDLTFASNNATDLRSLRLFNNSAFTTGVNDRTCFYTLNNELYFIDGAGNTIQVTLGGSLNLGASIISIQLGISAGACVFTGSITGTTLTVSSITIGSLSNGLLLQDAGLLQQNTLIQNQVSGTPGGAGVYQVSIAQMITSEQMTATNLVNDVTMNINQAPAVSAANIQLALI